jgi:hypothetical protein
VTPAAAPEPVKKRATEDSNLRPPAPEADARRDNANQCAALCGVIGHRSHELIHGDLHCAELIRHEKSRRSDRAASAATQAADESLRVAIKVAVDAGDYERATALLDVAKRTRSAAASFTPPRPDRGSA